MKDKFKKSIIIVMITLLLKTYSILIIARYPEYEALSPDGEKINIVEVSKNPSEEDLKNNLRQIKKSYDDLYELNQDTIGWMHMPNVFYEPVMNTGDNDFYLYRDVHKNYSRDGELFMSKASENTFDDVSLIYGHNMASGVKFGRLKLLRGEDFFRQNQDLYLYDSVNDEFKVFKLYSLFYHIDGTERLEIPGLKGSQRDEFYQRLYNKSRFKRQEGEPEPNFQAEQIILQTCLTATGLERDVAVFELVDTIPASELN